MYKQRKRIGTVYAANLLFKLRIVDIFNSFKNNQKFTFELESRKSISFWTNFIKYGNNIVKLDTILQTNQIMFSVVINTK